MLNHSIIYEHPGLVMIEWEGTRIIFNTESEDGLFILPLWIARIGKEHFAVIHRTTLLLYYKVLEYENAKNQKVYKAAVKSFWKWLWDIESSDKVVKLTLSPLKLGRVKLR